MVALPVNYIDIIRWSAGKLGSNAQMKGDFSYHVHIDIASYLQLLAISLECACLDLFSPYE